MGCDAENGENKNPQHFKHYQCVTFNGKVGNYETDIVIDSGSGITIMSLELFNLINKFARTPLEMSYNSVLARSVTGESLDIVGTTCVELDLEKALGLWSVMWSAIFSSRFCLGPIFSLRPAQVSI